MSKKQQTNYRSVSHFSRLTRVMAAFTASLFLVSSNLALPAQANDLAQAARGDMSRQEWRQFRQENRNAGLPSRGVPLPVFSTQPITVPVSGAEPINPPPVLHHTAPNLNLSGGLTTVGTRQERREARRENREARREARTGTAVPQPITPKVRETREARTERIQTHQAEKLSRFVIQENAGALIKLDNGANLDLTASSRNITLGDKLFADGGFVTIEVGGEKKNVYAGSKVSAAEYVAVKQVLGGKQEIVVNGDGIATGGTVDLNNLAASRNNMKASGLTVASGVTAVGDLAKDSSFRINGDLNNFGNVYAVASEKGRHAGDINAENITNNAGALISSDAGNKHGNRADAIDLSLNADKNFTNFGTIESSGDLNISAGNSIKNSGSTSAKNNVSLNSSDIANSGTVSAKLGNVTLDSPVATVMNVNNEGGKIQALNGSINVRAPGNVDALDSNIAGGDLLSREVNLQAGQGLVEMNVNALTGVVNGTGVGAHVTAHTDVLNLGELCLTGDPTYKNAGGSINITGNLTAAEAIAILASGDITASAANITITARQANGFPFNNDGFLVTMAAGYEISGTGTDTTTAPGTTAGPITINSGGTATGGSINLGTATSFNINTNGTVPVLGNANGGNVQLYANRVGGTGGNITLPTASTINTSGANNGSNGNVTIAGAGALTLSNITANGGSGGGGNITIRNVNPTTSGGGVTFTTTGAQSSGTFTTAGPATGGSVSFNSGAVLQGRNTVTVDNFGTATSAAGGLTINSNSGTVSINALNTNAGAFNVSANNLTLGGNVTTGNFNVNVGGGNITGPAGLTVAADAYNVTAGTFSVGAGQLNITSRSNNTSIGINGGAGTVQLSTTEMADFITSQLNVTTLGTGVLTNAGTQDISGTAGTTAGAYSLNLTSGNNIAGGGNYTLGGNSLTATANGSVTLGNITGGTGAAAIDVSANAGNLTLGNLTNANGLIDVDASGSVNVGTITTVAGVVDVDAGGTATVAAITKTGAGAITVDGTSVTVTGATSSNAGGSVTYTNTSGLISTGAITTTTGLIDLGNGTGTTITTGALQTAGGNIDIDAGTALQIASIAATAGGTITLDAGTNVTVTGNITGSATSLVVNNANGLIQTGNITTSGLVDLGGAGTTSISVGAVNSGAGLVDLDSTGTIQATSITTTDAVDIDAGQAVTISGATSGDTGVAIDSVNSSINVGSVTTVTGTIDLNTSPTGTTITTGALQTNGGNIDIDAGTAVQIASINALNGGTFTIDAGTDVTLVGAVTGNAASLVVNNTNGTINTVGITTNGAIDLGGAGTTAITVAGALSAGAGAVTLDATGAIGVSGAITTTGSVAANGASVAYASIGGPTASVTLNATGGQVNGGTITSAGAIDLDATTSIATTDLVGLSVDADAASISVGTVTTSAGGSVSLTATAGSVLAGTISAADGLVDVDATTTANLGDVTTTGAVTVDGNTGVTTLNIGGAASSIVLNSTAGAISTGTLTATGLIDVGGNTTTAVTTGAISTTGGNVDLDSATTVATGNIGAGAGNINVDAGTTSNLGVLTNTGTIAVNAGTDSTIAGINNAAGSSTFPGPFQVSVIAGNNNTFTGNINGGTGNIYIEATTGDATLQNATLTTGTLVIVAGNNTTAGVLQTTDGGIDIDSGNNTSVTTITTTNGNIDIDSGNDTTIGTVSTTGGMLDVNSGGTTTIGTINIGADVIIVSDNDINIGTTTTTQDIFLYSGANINVLGNLTADPIVMTALANVNLGGSLIADDGITVVAGQDIQNTVGGIAINGNGLTNGGNITMVAGADYTEIVATSVTINGSSASGGSILLNNVPGFGNITANGAAGTGGDITLSAFSNGFNGGSVLLPTTSGIITTGSGANASGDVTVVAGAINGQGVQIGSITQSTATNGAAGAVTIVQAATPNAGQVIVNDASYTGAFQSNAYGAADIRTGNITNRAGSVNVSGAGNVGLGTVNVSGRVAEAGGSITILAQGSDVFDIGIAGGNNFALGLQANGGTTSGAGGTINLTNLGSTGIRTQTAFSITTVNGAGGNLILNGDQGNISLANGTYGVNAGTTGSAGNIVLTGAGVLVTGGGSAALQANGAGGGNGGNITITGTGAPGLTFGTGAGQLTVSTTGATNGVVNANVGGNLTVSATGGFTANAIILTTTGAGSDITVNGALTSTLGTVLNSNDAIAINSTVNGGAGVLATAGGTINGSGSANGTQVILNSTGGDIGNSSASRLNVNATDLVAIAQAGSVFLNDTAGGVNLIGATVVPGFGSFGPSSAANTFDLVATGGALSNSAAGSVTASDVVLRSTNSTVTLNGVVTGTNSASIRGTGMTTAGVGLVSGGTVTLTADTGDVGTSTASRFQVDATNLVVNATAAGGDAFINDANNVNIGPGASVVTGNYDLTAGGDITSSGALTANNAVLSAGNAFILGSTIIGNTSISLTSVASITDTNVAGATLTTPQLNLTSTGGSIGSSSVSRLNIDAVNLTAVANGGVFITDANNVNITGVNTAGGNFDVAAANNISTAAGSTITSTTGSVLLRGIAGTVTTAGTITANTAGQSVTLRAGQSILNGQVGGTFTTPTLNLISDNGNIGASTASRFNIGLGVANVTANAAAGSVFLTTAATVNLGGGASSALNTFDVLGTGGTTDITTSGPITAATIVITAGDDITANGSITATGNVTLTANDDIATNAAVSGNNVSYVATTGGVTLGGATTGTTSISITSNDSILNASITGGLTAPQINLTTNNDIGVNAGARLNLNAVNLTVNAGDDVFINDTAGGVNFTGANTADVFNIQANGDISNSGTINTGALTFAATGAGSDILVNNVINSTGALAFTANGAGGVIAIGANVTATGAITMSADGNLTTAPGVSVVNNNNISLNSNNGSIGTGTGSRFLLDAINTQVTAANGDVFIEDLDTMALDDLTANNTAGGTFDALANGDLTVNTGNDITATNVVLRAGGAAGILNLNASVTGTASVSLRAAGNIAAGDLGGAANVVAPQINLTSDTGSIGLTAGTRLQINATNLTANAANNVFINDTAGGINIGAASSAAGGTFDITTTGAGTDLSTSGSITALNINLSSQDDLTIGSALNATNNIVLTNNAGDDVVINGTLTAGNNITVTSDDNLNVNAAVVGGGTVAMTADNQLISSAAGTINGNIVNLTANGGTASVQLGGAVTGTTSITINSNDDILNASIVGGLTAPTITLISGDDIGNVADRLNITATNLSLQAADDIHVSATGSVNLLASSAGDIFNVLAANNLTSTGAITGDNVVLRAVAGSLGLGANVNGTTDVTLRSFNGLTNLNFTTITTGAGGTINLISDNGDIGTSPTSRLTLDADNLTANAANGSVYIFDTDSVNLGAGSSSAANNFNVSAAVNLTNSGTVSADNVTLRATAGSLTLNALVSGVTSVTLRSGLNITDAAVVSVVSDQINLISDNGNVGTLANPLNIDALNLTANAFAGDVYINDANTISIGAGSSSALTTFSVTAGLNLFTTGTILAQDVILTATNGSLFVGAQITGGTSISLTQAFTMTNANIFAPLVSPQINLTSTAGSIGTGTFNRLTVDAASISFNAAGSVYFQDPNTVNVSSATATGTIDILANNNLSNSGAITATDIVLTSTVADVNIGAAVTASNTLLIDAGNNINLGANVSGGTSVTLDAGGTINQTAGTVGGGDLVLNFVTGPVTLATNVATLTTNAAGQTLTINENSGITLLNQNLANLNVTAAIGAPGDLVVQNALNLTSLNLATSAGIGNIVLNASTTTTGDTTLQSSGTITQNAGTITADELGLLWVTGNVFLQTDVVDLSANGGGNSLNISDLGSINLLQILGMQDLVISANGSISTTSGVLFNISVLGDILFFANAGDVILNSNLAAVDDITLSASGTITQNAGQILSDDLALNWGTGNVTLATDVNSLSSNSSGNNLTINEASGIVLNSQNVTDLTINAGLASAGNIALGTALNIPGVLILDNNNGDIVLGANDVDALSATLNASGTISQAVTNNIDTGSLFLAFGAGPVTLNTVIDFLVTNAPGQTLVINQTGDIQLGFQDLNSLTVTAASDIETTVDFTVADLNLTATGGSILFNSNVNVTNVGNYVADDTISQGIGFILGGEGTANLTWVNGNVGLNTAIATLTADGGTNSLTITENTGLNIGALVLGSINVAAGIVTPGDINLNTANTVDTVTLTTDGDININANLISATSASFTASGDITQAGATTITTPDLTVGNTGLNTGTITILDTVGTGLGQSITVVGLSNASITTNELGFVALQASTANTLTIDASDSLLFSFAGDATVATTLSVTAPNVLNQNDVIATTINIQSAAGVDLNIDGGTGGTWTAFAGGTNFTAGLGGDLTLFGTQDIFGVATFSVSPFQTITIDSGAVITGDSSVTLNTCNLNLNGILIGNPIIFNCPLGAGTIANSGGNVVLTSDLIFNGLDLAIIASGSIIESGITTIDLSNSGGDGGSLTLLAGFDFTPATVGTEGPGFPGGAILRTVTGTSLSGGSIQLGTTNITTAATGVLGAGGSVFAAASGGNVELNNVDTSAAFGPAGTITVTGENGITVNGNISAAGATGATTTLQVGTSVVNGQVLLGNGEMFGTGSIDFGTATLGSITVTGTFNATNGDVVLTGALGSGDSITTASNLTADSLTINAGVGDTIISLSAVNVLNSNSNGFVQLANNVGNLAINNVTGATQDLNITNYSGNVNFNAVASINSLVLLQDDLSAFGVSINGAITTAAGMQIVNNGSNDLVVNAALSSGTGDVNLSQNGAADILVNANLTTTGGGDIVLFAGDVISTLAGTTLNSSSDISIEAVNAVLVGANSTITSIGDTTFKSDNDDVTFGLNTFVSAGGAVNINADQDVVTGGDIISTTVTNITATNGEVILNGALSGLGDVNVTAATDLTFNSGINSIGTLGNVVISVGDQVVLNAGDTDVNGTDVTITATNGIVSSGAQGFTANATAVLDINAAITIGGVLQLTGDSVSVSGAINANAGVSIGSEVATFTTEANITSSLGDVFITANTIANTFAITGNNVTLQSFTDGGLVIDGTAGPGGTVTATTGVIDVIANGTTGNLTFLGEQDFIAATTNFTVPPFSSIIISAGADVTASNVLNLNTCNLVLQGSLAAPTINFNCPLGAGTIANSIGNVDLSGVGVLNFSGSDLAIIASGNVLANGNTSINLSSATEDGGNLLVVAGFDFLPATGGQVNFVPTLFTVTGTSLSGGNIDLTGMTINTSSTFNNGGNVTLVANGGGLNDGTITTESINTSGVNFGGNVTIIGESDIALNGAVTTTGATGGDITIAVAQPILAPGPATLIGNGELLQGGFGVGAPTAGTLTALNLNAGNGDIALTVGNGLLDTTAITDMTADAVSFNVGDGSAFVSNSSVNELNISSYGTGNGFVGFVNNTGNLLLTANAPSNDLNASLFTSGTFTVGTGNHEYGSITIGGSTTTVDGNIDASSLVTVYGDDGVIVNGTIDSDSLVTLEILTAGNIDVNGAVTGANVRLTSLTATDNITVDAPITATNVGGEIRFTINGGTVNQTAALNSDIVNINGTSGQVFLTLATNTVDALNVNTNGSGSVAFTNSGNLALNVVANATQDLAVTASGTLDLQNAIVGDDVTLIGAGTGLNVDQTINATNVDLISNSGNLTIGATVTVTNDAFLNATGAAGDIVVNALVTGPTVTLTTAFGQGGDITLNTGVSGTTSLNLDSDGALTQTAGTITGGALSVTFETGATVLTTIVTSLTSTVNGTSLTVNEADAITLNANSGTNLNVNTTNGSITTTAPLSFANLNLNAGGAGSDLNLGADVTGSTTIVLTAVDTINPSIGTVINGGALTLNFGNVGPTVLGTNVASLTTNNAGGTLTVTNVGDITLLAQTLSSLTVSTLNGSISTGAGFTINDLNLDANSTGATAAVTLGNAITVNNALTVTAVDGVTISNTVTGNGATNISTATGNIAFIGGSLIGTGNKDLSVTGTGNIQLNFGPLVGSTVNLTTNNGNINQVATAVVQANILNLSVTGGIADLSQAQNEVAVLNASGTGAVFFNNGTTALSIGALGGTQSLTASTTGAGSIAFGAAITTTGNINLTTETLNNTGFAINANDIDVQSNAGLGLVVNGGTGANIATYGATNGVTFSATFDNLVMNGNTTFTSVADLSALNGTDMIVVSAGANVIGQQMLTVHTCNLTLAGTLMGNPLVYDNPCGNGTIANSNGDVNLLGNIIYNGNALAIIASGSINAGGATLIDLSNNAGNGGNLTLIAGYDFGPPTGGQVTNGNQTYTFTGYSATGGSINLGTVDIITNGTGGNGGNVLAVAHTGSVLGSGAVTLADVTANGTNGGNVNVIAQAGINVQDINVTGTTAGGNVSLATAVPSTGAGNTVLNGVLTGSFTAGANNGQTIAFNSITSSGTGDVTLSGNLNSAAPGTVTGDVVTLNSSDDIGVDALNRFAVNANTVTGSAVGDAFIRNLNAGAATLGTVTVATGGRIDAYFTGNLTSGAQTAGVIELRTDGTLGVTGVLTGTTSIGLSAGATLTSAQVAAANLVTPLLTLRTSNNANIGASGTEFQVGAGVGEIRIDTVTNGGDSAFVRSLATAGVNLGLSQTTNDLTFLSDGPLTVIDDVTALEGNINITGTSGTVRIDNGVTVQANSLASNGNVFIGNALTGGNKKTTFIQFGDGAQIIGNAAVKPGGNVTIQMGTLTTKNNPLNQPKNVTFDILNGGAIQGGKSAKPFYAGKNGDPQNIVRADGAIVFISNTMKNKNIVLEGNVLIQADPPSVAGESAALAAFLPNGGSVEAASTKSNGLTTSNLGSNADSAAAGTMLNTMFNSGITANTAIGTDLTTTATTAGIGTNGAGSTVTAADNVKTLAGGVSAIGEDNSYMVGGYGPTAQAEASICSDIDLGVSNEGVARTAHSNRVVLKKGNVLFVPFQNTVVETPHGTVSIEAKSVALISISDDKLAVYDFEDSHKGSVTVDAHGQHIALAPGNHVTVAHEAAGEFAQVNAIEAIPHRNVATKTIKAGVKAHTSEFSVASAIQSVKPLQLVMSSKHPQAKQVANKMMKTTAILLHMGGNGGEFQHYFKPAMTAMAK